MWGTPDRVGNTIGAVCGRKKVKGVALPLICGPWSKRSAIRGQRRNELARSLLFFFFFFFFYSVRAEHVEAILL
jgi:hypothetical protein